MKFRAENLWTYITEGGDARGVLDPATSYLPKGYFFKPAFKKGYTDGRIRLVKYDYDTKLYRFPTGLLKNVIDHLREKEWRFDLEDNRDFEPMQQFVDVLADGTSLYDYQREAVRAIGQAGRGIVQLATGSGKSFCGAAIIASYGGRWLWLTHRLNLAYQSRDVLQNALGSPVGLLGDGISEIRPVTVAMVQTVHRVLQGTDSEAKRFLLSLDGLIGDEIHHVDGGSEQWFGTLSNLPALWRVGLTATPKLHGEGLHLLAVTGPVVHRVDATALIAMGKLVPPRIWFVKIEEPSLPKKLHWAGAYRDGIVDNVWRTGAVVSVARQFAAERKSTLILVKQIKHGKALRDALEMDRIRAGWIEGSVSIEDRNRQLSKLWEGKLDAIVAVAETLGEGTDLPPLQAIINATGQRGGGDASEGDSGRVTIQILGRGLRTYPGKTHCEYVDFLDLTQKALTEASKDRVSTLEAEGYAKYIRYWSDYEPTRNMVSIANG